MERITTPTSSDTPPTSFSNNPEFLDPLLEQMSSIRLLTTAPPAPRERRFSDTDRPTLNTQLVQPDFLVKSKGKQPASATSSEQDSDITETRLSNSDGPDTHNCSSEFCAVEKVFATPELLEIILTYLDPRSVLLIRRVSRQWYSTIESSPELRLHFFRYQYGQWNRDGEDFKLLPLSVPGLEIKPAKEIGAGQWISASLTPTAVRLLAPRPRKRVRSRSIYEGLRGGLGRRTSDDIWPADRVDFSASTLDDDWLISQPPITGMQAFIEHTKPKDDGNGNTTDGESVTTSRACAKIHCEAGITLGFLADEAQKWIDSKDAGSPSDLGEKKIVFKAIMSFCVAEQRHKHRSYNRIVTRLG